METLELKQKNKRAQNNPSRVVLTKNLAQQTIEVSDFFPFFQNQFYKTNLTWNTLRIISIFFFFSIFLREVLSTLSRMRPRSKSFSCFEKTKPVSDIKHSCNLCARNDREYFDKYNLLQERIRKGIITRKNYDQSLIELGFSELLDFNKIWTGDPILPPLDVCIATGNLELGKYIIQSSHPSLMRSRDETRESEYPFGVLLQTILDRKCLFKFAILIVERDPSLLYSTEFENYFHVMLYGLPGIPWNPFRNFRKKNTQKNHKDKILLGSYLVSQGAKIRISNSLGTEALYWNTQLWYYEIQPEIKRELKNFLIYPLVCLILEYACDIFVALCTFPHCEQSLDFSKTHFQYTNIFSHASHEVEGRQMDLLVLILERLWKVSLVTWGYNYKEKYNIEKEYLLFPSPPTAIKH
jgi:hypothetical protein